MPRAHAITLEDLMDPSRIIDPAADAPGRGTRTSPASSRTTGNAAAIAGRCENRGADGRNKTERGFEVEVLEPLRLAGALIRVDFEPVKLRIGPDWKSTYRPDFRIQWIDGHVDLIEVKGFWLDDARAKIKAAAELHPETFRAVMRVPKRDGGGWTVETIGPRRSWDQAIEEAVAIVGRYGRGGPP